MKPLFLFIFLLGLSSCRGNNEDHTQKIDQILHFYVKDSKGNDLLNSKKSNAFHSVEFKDMGGNYDRMSVSITSKINQDSTHYKEYIAGAVRALQPNGTDEHKIYKSDIAIQFKKTDSSAIEEDRMEIFYEWTPQVFQIKTILYNQNLIFTKKEGHPNSITILK